MVTKLFLYSGDTSCMAEANRLERVKLQNHIRREGHVSGANYRYN